MSLLTKRLVLVCSLGLLIWLWWLPNSAAGQHTTTDIDANGATILLEQSTTTLDFVDVNVKVLEVADLAGFEFTLNFDTAFLTAIENIQIHETLGATTNCSPDTGRCALSLGPTETASGSVNTHYVGGYSYGSGVGFTGSGTVATIRFTLNGQSGITEVGISNPILLKSDSIPLTATSQNATLQLGEVPQNLIYLPLIVKDNGARTAWWSQTKAKAANILQLFEANASLLFIASLGGLLLLGFVSIESKRWRYPILCALLFVAFALVSYSPSATASPIPRVTIEALLSKLTLATTLPMNPDTNSDTVVNLVDIMRVAAARGATDGSANWLAELDIDHDLDVDDDDTTRVAARWRTPLTTLVSSSPADGEGDVAVTRETIVRFSRGLDGGSVDAASIVAKFGGYDINSRLQVSSDRQKATLFYIDDLPASARVRVNMDGSQWRDIEGYGIDLNGDGLIGGTNKIDFDTLSLTVVPGTSVCGRVFASEQTLNRNRVLLDVPLGGVAITVDGKEDELFATTDAAGNFCLDPAPAGEFFVHIDGRTVDDIPTGAYYPFVGKKWTSIIGQQVDIGNIYLPLIPDGTLQLVSNTADTEVSFPDSVIAQNPALADVTVTVPAGSLFADDGAQGGMVGIASVAPDRLPEALPEGLDFPLVITIQTDGATNFDTPAPVCFPNLPDPNTNETLAPGEKSALWSFDHDIGRFDVVGSMTVNEAGSLICTDDGVGVVEPGWHGTQPGSNDDGCSNNSGDCQSDGGSNPNQSNPGQEAGDNLPPGIEKKRGVDTNGLRDEFDDIWDDIIDAYRDSGLTDNGFPPLISDGHNDNRNSHDDGNSIDLSSLGQDRTRRMSQEQQRDMVEDLCNCETFSTPKENDPNRRQGNWDTDGDGNRDFVIIIEDPGGPNQHTHIQYRPRNDCDRCNNNIQPQEALRTENSSIVPTDNPSRLQVSGGPYYMAVEVNGVMQRLMTETNGSYSLILPPNTKGYIHLFDPISGYVKHGTFYSAANGQGTDIFHQTDSDWESYKQTVPCYISELVGTEECIYPNDIFPDPLWNISYYPDTDEDGLNDDVERIIGSNPLRPDSDNDGIEDGAEIQQGLNPLDGLAVETGIVASADTPGTAVDVCALNNLAAVADSDMGASIFNVFNGMNPTIIAQVDTSGSAKAVACTNNLIAVADGPAGLAIADITDPPAAFIVHQVDLGTSVNEVATYGNIAFVTTSTDIVMVDMFTGDILDRKTYAVDGQVINDLAIADNHIYLLTVRISAPHIVHKIPLVGYLEEAVDTLTVTEHPTFGRMHIFAGGGYVYVGAADDNWQNQAPGIAIIKDDPETGLEMVGPPSAITAFDVTVNGSGLALFTGADPGLTSSARVGLLDVTDPTATDAFLTSFDTPDAASAVTIYNGQAFVADQLAGLQVINYLSYDALGVPPTISMTTSFPDGLAEEGQIMELTASVTDDVQVRNVKFFVNGQERVIDGNFPFEYQFITPLIADQPAFTIQAEATDTGGNVATTSVMTVTLVPDATPPRVTQVTPAVDGRFLSGEASSVSATFSEPLDPVTLTPTSFILTSAGADFVFGTADDAVVNNGSLNFREDSNRATMTFDTPIADGVYKTQITTDITDLAGNPLGNMYEWQFTVGLPVTWDGGGDGISWEDPLNWSIDDVPNENDIVIIDLSEPTTIRHSFGNHTVFGILSDETLEITGGTLTITGRDSTLGTLILESGTLNGDASLRVGEFTWRSGTLAGDGATTVDDTINLSSVESKYLEDARTLNNAGNAIWEQGSLFMRNDAIFNNLPGALFDIQHPDNINYFWYDQSGINGTPAINNQGTFRKSSGGGITYISPPFNNATTVDMLTGELYFNGDLVSSGNWLGSSNSLLTFGSGNHTIEQGAVPLTIDVAHIRFAGGTTTISGTVSISETLLTESGSAVFTPAATVSSIGTAITLTSGTFDLSSGSSFSIDSMSLSGGVFTGSDDVTTASLDWQSGTLRGSGSLTATNSISFSSLGAKYLEDTRTLSNVGTAIWEQGSLFMRNDAIFNNLPGALFDIQHPDNTNYFWYDQSGINGTPAINNQGTFRKSAGEGITYIYPPFNNATTVDMLTGELYFNGDLVSSGNWLGSSNSLLTFGSGNHTIEQGAVPLTIDVAHIRFAGGTTTISGTVSISETLLTESGSAVFTPAATVSSIGTAITLTSGTFDLSSGSSFSIDSMSLSGGVFTGSDDVTTASLDWQSGTLRGSGSLTATNSISFSSLGAKYLEDTRTLSNVGTAIWEQGSLFMRNDAIFNNLPGALFDIQHPDNTNYFWYDQSGINGTPAINNQGTFRKSAGEGITYIYPSFNNNGTVDIQVGQVVFGN